MSKRLSRWLSVFLFLLIIIFYGNIPLKAQQETNSSDGWNFVVAPYVLFPYMNGFVAVRGNESAVAVGPGDIFSNLNIGAMIYAEGRTADWAVMVDILYMDLEETGEGPIFGRRIDTNVKQLMMEVTGMRRITPSFELGVGLRVNSIDGALLVQEGIILPELDVSGTQTWIDPFIAARLEAQLEDPWRLGIRGDIGGFGISSDFTWQLYPYFGHRFSKLFEMVLAYRWLGINYSTGSGNDRFEYDMTNFGPEFGFLFHF
jgi:hypothetical protein